MGIPGSAHPAFAFGALTIGGGILGCEYNMINVIIMECCKCDCAEYTYDFEGLVHSEINTNILTILDHILYRFRCSKGLETITRGRCRVR